MDKLAVSRFALQERLGKHAVLERSSQQVACVILLPGGQTTFAGEFSGPSFLITHFFDVCSS